MEIDEKKVGIKEQIVEVLKTCYDPEIPVDIYELGLIYDVDVDDDNNAYIKMTLTSPACPVAGSLPIEVENKVKTINELNDVKVDVVWDPPWDQSMMSEAAKLELGFF
jgi:FeS assembly SUF system protein